MPRGAVPVLQVVLALSSSLLLVGQVVVLPDAAEDTARRYPEAAFSEWPVLRLAIATLACTQVAVVCVGSGCRWSGAGRLRPCRRPPHRHLRRRRSGGQRTRHGSRGLRVCDNRQSAVGLLRVGVLLGGGLAFSSRQRRIARPRWVDEHRLSDRRLLAAAARCGSAAAAGACRRPAQDHTHAADTRARWLGGPAHHHLVAS
jgi:hypothetical protein